MKRILNPIKSGANFKKGFTLIELLVVMAIIGVLTTLLMANFIEVRKRARDGQRKSDLRQIQISMEQYRADNGIYPTLDGSVLWNMPTSSNFTKVYPTYMQVIPQDPSTLANCPGYLLYVPSDGSTYVIFSSLENANDSDARLAKPVPASVPSGSFSSPECSTPNSCFKVGSSNCNGSVYNYWVTNP